MDIGINQSLSQPIECQPSQKEGSAVGVPERKWFIAIVKNNTELVYSKKLESLGFETFVPVQEIRVQDKTTPKGTKFKILLPAMILIHCTEENRKEIVRFPFIYRFMTDRSMTKDSFNRHPIASIPEYQIEKLKFMTYNSNVPVGFEQSQIMVGDSAEVVRGKLQGLIGNVIKLSNSLSKVYIRIDFLGDASVMLPSSDVKKLKKQTPKNEH